MRMPQYTTCPNCHAFHPIIGDPAEAKCPNCGTPAGAIDSVSAKPKPLPPNKTVLAEPEAMIRYTCPKCKRGLESPASFAGQKLNCPHCSQRLQIPHAPPPAAAPTNKTVLATLETPSSQH